MPMKPTPLALTLLAGLLLLGSAELSRAENWPAWRGPRGDGSSTEPGVPTKWSATENIAWKTELPGQGHSSPVVWGERIFLTSAVQETQERLLLCLDRTSGRILWQQTVLRAPLEKKNAENSYASATPATDGKYVYVSFLDGKEVAVAAYDFTGKQVWLVRPGPFKSMWGFCHTPLLFEDMVIVDCAGEGDGFIVALDRASGKTRWKMQRQASLQYFSTPLLRELAGRPQLIVPGNKAVASYDPRDGKQLWTTDGPSDEFVATPVYNEQAGLILACSSWPKKVLVAIRPDGQGNVTQSKVAWSTAEGAPYVPSPIAVGDCFYTAANNGEVYCYEAATGKILWHTRMGLHHASPVSVGGLVYFLNDQGVMNVVKAGPKYELVAQNKLGEKTFASPAISEGQLFLRGFKSLYCIGQRAK